MAGGGFIRGAKGNDSRYQQKHQKQLEDQPSAAILKDQVDLKLINFEVIKPWIGRRLIELLEGFEDDVLIQLVTNMLEDTPETTISTTNTEDNTKITVSKKIVDHRELQLQLAAFLSPQTALDFVTELWTLLCSAQQHPEGIPEAWVEEMRNDFMKKQQALVAGTEVARRIVSHAVGSNNSRRDSDDGNISSTKYVNRALGREGIDDRNRESPRRRRYFDRSKEVEDERRPRRDYSPNRRRYSREDKRSVRHEDGSREYRSSQKNHSEQRGHDPDDESIYVHRNNNRRAHVAATPPSSPSLSPASSSTFSEDADDEYADINDNTVNTAVSASKSSMMADLERMLREKAMESMRDGPS